LADHVASSALGVVLFAALAAIPEYWLIDPEARRVTVLVRSERAENFRQHGEFAVGQIANSVAVPGSAIDAQALFACALSRLYSCRSRLRAQWR